MEISNIAVIGAGTMGHCFAMIFAQAGFGVRLHDISAETLETAKGLIKSNLGTLAEAGQFDPDDIEAVSENRIRYTTNLAEAVAEAEFVLEAVVENIEVKQDVFAELDKLCPETTILASNTSYLNIHERVKISHPERLVIAHWFAPPHIVPLVEIVPGPETSPDVVAAVKQLCESLGKETIVLNKFLEGFVANRLQAAMNLEVLHLLDNGYATPEDIDKAAKSSFGLRLPIIGVVQRMDFTGLDLVNRSLTSKVYRPPEVRGYSESLSDQLSRKRLGVKNGKGFFDYQERSPEEIMKERDIRLMKLKAFLDNLD